MIPKTIDDVTAEWLSLVLDQPVSAFTANQIGQGVGLLGDIFCVSLSSPTPASSQSERRRSSVVIKLPSSFEENRQQAVALGMFDAEIRFYRDLAPAAKVGLPEIYHAEIAENGSDFVIVMEDLSHLTMVDQHKGMSAEQALAAVKVLAQIHAVWWDQVKTPDFEWIPSMIGPRIEFVDQLLLQIATQEV